MSSCTGKILKNLDIFGKQFQICTTAGYVAFIDRTKLKNLKTDLQISNNDNKTKIFLKHKDFDIYEVITIDKSFNGKVGDKMVVTCIENKSNGRFNISLFNIDSGQLLTLNSINNFIYLLDKAEKLKIVILEWLLGFSIVLFLHHAISIEESYKIDGAIACYCIAVIFYLVMSIFLKMNMERKRSRYASSIQETIEAISEQVHCPIRFKFAAVK